MVALQTDRTELQVGCEAARGATVERVLCKGKRIFLRFSSGAFLHNHLLMRGSWRRADGPFLFVPPGMWLAVSVPGVTVCNWNGQMLRWETEALFRQAWDALGPDVLDPEVSIDALVVAIAASPLAIGETLLDQGCLSGLGNVARAEALFLAGQSPATPSRTMAASRLTAVATMARKVMKDSLREGGRWIHRVYHRAGEPCPECGTRIRVARLAPSRRAIYFCPRCQRD